MDDWLSKLGLMAGKSKLVDPGELYQRQPDPDLETITKLNDRVKHYDAMIADLRNRIRAIDSEIMEKRKRLASVSKGSIEERRIQTEGGTLITQRKKLEQELAQADQRRENFNVTVANMRKMKTAQDDSLLLKEANVRMQLTQEGLNVSEMRSNVKDARHLNSNVERLTGLFDEPLTLDETATYESQELFRAQFTALELTESEPRGDDPLLLQSNGVMRQGTNVRTNNNTTLNDLY